MKLVQPSALVLFACTFASQAQPGQSSTDPRRVLQDIEYRTGIVRDRADGLTVIDKDPRTSTYSRTLRLAEISDQMNAINRDLRFLDAHKDSLAVWEVQAIGQAAPLLVETAHDTDAAIEALKIESAHLAMAPNYDADVEKIFADSTKAQRVLRDYFNLQAARQKEHRATTDLGY